MQQIYFGEQRLTVGCSNVNMSYANSTPRKMKVFCESVHTTKKSFLVSRKGSATLEATWRQVSETESREGSVATSLPQEGSLDGVYASQSKGLHDK